MLVAGAMRRPVARLSRPARSPCRSITRREAPSAVSTGTSKATVPVVVTDGPDGAYAADGEEHVVLAGPAELVFDGELIA